MQMTTQTHEAFGPLYNENSKILILGSFPSVKSREQGFYYGHPQNRFWRVVASIYNESIPQTIDEKRDLVLKHGIALYDVIDSCSIAGSSDASIRDVVPSNLTPILLSAPIEHIYTNGKTAGKLYQKYQAKTCSLSMTVLPSTSPANARCSLDQLICEWKEALQVVE